MSDAQVSISHVLVINAGSSSIKIALYGNDDEKVFAAKLERDKNGNASAKTTTGPHWLLPALEWTDVKSLTSSLRKHLNDTLSAWPIAIGHRIVHGGRELTKPTELTAKVILQLEALSPLAPEHLPYEIDLIKAFSSGVAEVKQIGCFDTAFHRSMPVLSRIFPIPRKYFDEGIERFGFHGLSYGYLREELRTQNEPAIRQGKVILAHLGNGSSLAALLDGNPLDTTMGFTPAGGCMMGTRSGDLDPGLFRYLSAEKKMSAEEFDRMINHESGLLGVSGLSADVRSLTESASENSRQALELYCLQIRKTIGALAAHLGGLDLLVFSGGIGENSALIRERVCASLGFLGIQIEPEANARSSDAISSGESAVRVLVLKTDEEVMILRQCRGLLR